MAIIFYDEDGKKGIPDDTFDQLAKDSDRAVGIVGGSIVEQRLTELLLSRFPSGDIKEKIVERLFQSGGALGSFSVKIDAAYLFGLLTDVAWRELVTIKDIRNRFAHYLDISSFQNDRIKGLVANLKLIEQTIPTTHDTTPGIKVSTGASISWGRPSNYLAGC